MHTSNPNEYDVDLLSNALVPSGYWALGMGTTVEKSLHASIQKEELQEKQSKVMTKVTADYSDILLCPKFYFSANYKILYGVTPPSSSLNIVAAQVALNKLQKF